MNSALTTVDIYSRCCVDCLGQSRGTNFGQKVSGDLLADRELRVKNYRKKGYHILHLQDDVTMLSDLDVIKPIVTNHVAKRHTKVALRFSGSPHLSSHSIAVLITCNGKVRDSGGSFVVLNASENVREFLGTLGIIDRFDLRKSEDDL